MADNHDEDEERLRAFLGHSPAYYWEETTDDQGDYEDDDTEGAGDPDYVDEPDEGEEEEVDDEDEFRDAEDGEDEDADLPSPTPAQRIMGLIRALIQNPEVGNVYLQPVDDDDEPEPRRRGASPSQYEKVPSDEGRALMSSGRFGTDSNPMAPRKSLARRIFDRELGLGTRLDRTMNNKLMAQGMIPSTKAEMIIHYDEPVYSGQFSDDGNFFYACGHDFKVRMYDTSNPYNWKHYKTAIYPFGQWTLTDASLSPDNKWLAYTSIQSSVSLAPTDPNDTGDPYQLDLAGEGNYAAWRGRRSFGIWSVRFSGDGRELVAGTNGQSIIVYDIESRTVLHSVRGHADDVNAVCFADKSSPHIIYSGSDDTTIKVWDRRSMGDGREAGAFVGHVEGLTYIDSKGDGRYILSNAKDQTMKLWDLRMVMSASDFRDKDPMQHTRDSDFDYRWHDYENWFPHPNDNSLVTFRGHSVLRTLIRCHFSPPNSTDSRYVYSGSHDGKVYVWNMDATIRETIDVRAATLGSRPIDRRYRLYASHSGWSTCVRDASWHPHAPLLVASAWNGFNMTWGTCTLHSFNYSKDDEAEPKMGRSVNEKLTTDLNFLRDV